MAVLADMGVLQRFTDLIVIGVVLGMAALGFQQGLFLATLAGLGAIGTLLVSLGLGDWMADFLVSSVDVPVEYAFPTAVGVLAVAGGLGARFAIGAAVPEGTLRFAPLVDKVGGVLVGGLAGMIVAGTLLVILSTMPIPEPYRIDGSRARFDLGTRMLRTFVRFIEPDAAARELVLRGEPSPPGAAADGPVCSELFADTNGDGQYSADAGERYLDDDDNKTFTPGLPFQDTNANGLRDIGLLERYRLGAWNKLRVMHHPMITSKEVADVAIHVNDGAVVYQATAADLDAGDTLTFSLHPPAEEASPGHAQGGHGKDRTGSAGSSHWFAIDPASGAVTVTDADTFMRHDGPARIVVVATDKLGLTAEKTVTIRYRGQKPRDE